MSQVLLLASVMVKCRRKSRSLEYALGIFRNYFETLQNELKSIIGLIDEKNVFLQLLGISLLFFFFFPSPLKTVSCDNTPSNQIEVDNYPFISEYFLLWLLNHASIFCTSESPIFPSCASAVLQSSGQRKAVLSCIESPLCSGLVAQRGALHLSIFRTLPLKT